MLAPTKLITSLITGVSSYSLRNTQCSKILGETSLSYFVYSGPLQIECTWRIALCSHLCCQFHCILSTSPSSSFFSLLLLQFPFTWVLFLHISSHTISSVVANQVAGSLWPRRGCSRERNLCQGLSWSSSPIILSNGLVPPTFSVKNWLEETPNLKNALSSRPKLPIARSLCLWNYRARGFLSLLSSWIPCRGSWGISTG